MDKNILKIGEYSGLWNLFPLTLDGMVYQSKTQFWFYVGGTRVHQSRRGSRLGHLGIFLIGQKDALDSNWKLLLSSGALAVL
jgi:hypothetical protein